MLSGNILLLVCSFSWIHVLVIVCEIHHETDVLHNLLVILSASSGNMFFLEQIFLKAILMFVGNSYGTFSRRKNLIKFIFNKLQGYVCNFTNKEVLFWGFLWNFLKLSVRLFTRSALSSYYLFNKTCKGQSDYLFACR